MKKIIITSILFMIILLSASGTNKNPIRILQPSQVHQKNLGNYEIETIDFNVEDKNIDGISYSLKGTMSIPRINKKKKMKLAIIIPGYYNDIDRYDKGFEYITSYIAQNGYLAIAIDTSPVYYFKDNKNKEHINIPKIINEHISILKEANDGNNIYDNLNLKNKIELNKIALISHRVNIEDIFKIVQEQKINKVNISSLLLITPINNKYVSNVDVKNIAILTSELDGTKGSYHGINIYNILRKYKNNNILSMTLLKNANNSYFNSKLEENDANQLNIDLKNQISREEQEEFLKRFVVDYLKSSFKNKYDNTIYDTKIPTVTKINNLDVINYLQTSKANNLKDIDNLNNYKAKNIKINLLNDSNIISKDDLLEINIPKRKSELIKLLNVKWEYKNGKLSFKPDISYFRKYDNISINLILDPDNESNIKGKSQSVCIELVDNIGKSQKIEISKDSNLISYPRGNLENFDMGDGREFRYWNQITPVSNIRIPMVMYNTINLKNIKRFNIIFDRTNSGDLLFESFMLD